MIQKNVFDSIVVEKQDQWCMDACTVLSLTRLLSPQEESGVLGQAIDLFVFNTCPLISVINLKSPKKKALEAAMNDINGSFGKGSVNRLGSAGGALVETFPSGVLTLDFALGGGLPKGRIVGVGVSHGSSRFFYQ